MRHWPRIVLPIAVILIGALGAVILIRSRPEVKKTRPEIMPPLVRVIHAERSRVKLDVTTQGTVSPRTESALVSEVNGRVTRVSPSFAAGGFFEKNDLLLSIDPTDYEFAVVEARARVAQAELRLAQQEAEAKVAQKEWQSLGEGDASPLTTRELQVADAKAALASAQARLEQTERDLDRTQIRAPYAGRVLEKSADIGQYVTRGSPIARIYAIDYVEVRLPLTTDDLAYLDLPILYRGGEERTDGPEVVLSARFAGEAHSWSGRLVRVEGEIDPRTRMVHAVARVDNPYGQGDTPGRPPLAIGLFVQAEIAGKWVDRAVTLPRSALRNESQVLIVDAEDRLRYRTIELVRAAGDQVVIGEGLADGDRVCLSKLDVVVDGMKVRTIDVGASEEIGQ